MVTKFFAPHPALNEFIESIVLIHIDFSLGDSPSPIYTFVPSHTRFICFYLQDPVKVKRLDADFIARTEALVIGPQLKPVVLDLGRKHLNISVGFKPSGMYRLLGIPLEELVDQDLDGKLVFGNEAEILIDRLLEARDYAKMNSIVQAFFLKKLHSLKPLLPFDKAMAALVQSGGNIEMEELASLSCLSIRQFQRQARLRIGHSPKLFSRLVRFSNAYKFKEFNPGVSWSEIFHRFGYFDHMHFIRDFKSFTDFTPGTLKEESISNSAMFHKLIS
jgi:AraC-like DNA-binding protein